MKSNPEYKMFFGRGGATVDYEDGVGQFTFVFDSAPEDRGKKVAKEKLVLSRRPVKGMKVWEPQSQADQDHLALMLERVQEYLRSLGFECRFEEP